jgi:hypothetical protein
MIELQSHREVCQRKAKLAELKQNVDFGDYNKLKYFRSDEPIPGTGGTCYTLYIMSNKVIVAETFIMWDCI